MARREEAGLIVGIWAAVLAAQLLCRMEPKVVPTAGAVLSGYCSQELIPDNSSYWMNLNRTLEDLVHQTPSATDFMFDVLHSSNGTAAYGEAMCWSSLSKTQCSVCLAAAVDSVNLDCFGSIAAMLTLEARCSIRYQDMPFF